MQLLYTLMEDEYLNDFHKSWNEACMKEVEQTQSMRYSAEFMRKQSQRLAEQVRQEEERLRSERKKLSKVGQ